MEHNLLLHENLWFNVKPIIKINKLAQCFLQCIFSNYAEEDKEICWPKTL